MIQFVEYLRLPVLNSKQNGGSRVHICRQTTNSSLADESEKHHLFQTNLFLIAVSNFNRHLSASPTDQTASHCRQDGHQQSARGGGFRLGFIVTKNIVKLQYLICFILNTGNKMGVVMYIMYGTAYNFLRFGLSNSM